MDKDDLRTWLTRVGYSHKEGAEALGLTLHAFRKLLYGQNRISTTIELLAQRVAKEKRRKTS